MVMSQVRKKQNNNDKNRDSRLPRVMGSNAGKVACHSTSESKYVAHRRGAGDASHAHCSISPRCPESPVTSLVSPQPRNGPGSSLSGLRF